MVPRFDAATVATALGVPSVDFLGRGAFGDTWRVQGTAVKIICEDRYLPARVEREVQGLMRVDSPHVVKLLSATTVHLGGKDRPALTFEYVPGGDLQEKIDTATRPTDLEALSLLRGLLTGLQDLHGADRTIHRDIKPQNIALRDGEWHAPVILDLGLAKSVTETTVTMYPSYVGTLDYMAPEQLEGQRAKKASDLFAVGVTVRYAITGEHPFWRQAGIPQGLDMHQLAQELHKLISAGPAPLPDVLAPEVREVLDRLVQPSMHERGSTRSNLKRLADIR